MEANRPAFNNELSALRCRTFYLAALQVSSAFHTSNTFQPLLWPPPFTQTQPAMD